MKKSIKSFFGGKADSEDKEAKGKEDRGKGGRPSRRWPLYTIGVFILVAVIAIVVVVLRHESSSGPATPTPTPTGSAGVTVSIKAPATVSAGGEFVARVEISGVQNFDSANYDVTYDPSVIEVTEVTDGTIDDVAVPVAMWDFLPSGVQGEAGIINNVPGVPGVNGSGSLAEIHFRVNGSAGESSTIGFSGETVLFNNIAAEIKADWVGSSIIVQ